MWRLRVEWQGKTTTIANTACEHDLAVALACAPDHLVWVLGKAIGYIQQRRAQMKLFVFDTETGGLDPSVHSILTLGGVVWEDGEVRDSIEITVAEPHITVDPEAMCVNKLNPDQIKATGLSPLDAVRRLEDFLRPHWPQRDRTRVNLAGHNVAFDYGFLQRLYRLAEQEMLKNGLPPSLKLAWATRMDRMFSYRLLDTQGVAFFLELLGRDHFPGGRSLKSLCTHYGVTNRAEHSALADAEATAQVLNNLIRVAGGSPLQGAV